jgi:hypothetical protein
MTTQHVQPAATQDATVVEYAALPGDGYLALLGRRASHRTEQASLVGTIPPCAAGARAYPALGPDPPPDGQRRCPVSIPLAVTEAAIAASGSARAVSDTASITAGVKAALAADRRRWGRWLVARLGDLPATATIQRDLVATLAEEFYTAADEIGPETRVPDAYLYGVDLTSPARSLHGRRHGVTEITLAPRELRALGPVEAVIGGRLVNLGPPKQRALFALLLSRADRPWRSMS